jgi:hypothetical protein
MDGMEGCAARAFGGAEETARAQLTRVLASGISASSPRLSLFLQFVVERASEGRADELKKYAIGVEVFERTSDFDSRIDPIVRVQGTAPARTGWAFNSGTTERNKYESTR